MLNNRVASLIIGADGKGRELSGLRFAFNIQKTSSKTPNKCSLRVWNLSPDSRKIAEAVRAVCILKAGYADDVGLVTIFAGNITMASTTQEGADWITELELQDGFLEFRDKKISVSFAENVGAINVLRGIASGFELPIRKFPDGIESKVYPSGFAFVGRSRDAMDKACQYLGLDWSIQNREIQIVNRGEKYKKIAYYLTPETGLIGSPTPEQKTETDKKNTQDGKTTAGYRMMSLMLPIIEPAHFIKVKSRQIDNEFFRVEEVTHMGDTHANDWHTQVIVRGL